MIRPLPLIADDISSFAPVGDNWLGLQSLVDELWNTGHPKEGMRQLLGVFERYPEEDGDGVFWAIVHGLEALPGYERALLESITRHPSALGTMMLGRLVRAGIKEVDGISLRDTLRCLSKTAASARIRKTAKSFASGAAWG